jgi:hypothetical protein
MGVNIKNFATRAGREGSPLLNPAVSSVSSLNLGRLSARRVLPAVMTAVTKFPTEFCKFLRSLHHFWAAHNLVAA